MRFRNKKDFIFTRNLNIVMQQENLTLKNLNIIYSINEKDKMYTIFAIIIKGKKQIVSGIRIGK